MRLIGKQMVHFYNDKNELVEGVKLHCIGLLDRVYGEACITHFVNINSPLYQQALDLPLGEIDIKYGFKGSIQGFVSLASDNK